MKINQDNQVLRAAYDAWSAASKLRAQRVHNKRFTYGDQWIDYSVDSSGRRISDWERYSTADAAPVTNNVLRQLVKTIVGRFRSQYLDARKARQLKRQLQQVYSANGVDELDSRALEDFLISGCAVQRVDADQLTGQPVVRNVNFNQFFVNAITDPMARDCEIVGQLHDMCLPDLLQQVAQGSRERAARVRQLYSQLTSERVAQFATSIGADSLSSTNFWTTTAPGKCRAIEVFTLESQEVLRCRSKHSGELRVVPIESPEARQLQADDDWNTEWGISKMWRCRWFSPMGNLLSVADAPQGHPFVLKFYPLTDGEVHGFIEDVIDQQKFLNRLVTLLDHIMTASAKGVLLYPESSLPDGVSWDTVRGIWQSSNGILPYSPSSGAPKPEQISKNNTDVGAYEMIKLQTCLLERISGVNGALQGQSVNTGGSVSLYRAQADNSSIALADIFDTFNAFRAQRDVKILALAKASA